METFFAPIDAFRAESEKNRTQALPGIEGSSAVAGVKPKFAPGEEIAVEVAVAAPASSFSSGTESLGMSARGELKQA